MTILDKTRDSFNPRSKMKIPQKLNKSMKKRKITKENIIVPVEWLNGLARHAALAEKDKDHVIHLIGFASSAKTLLKYGIRK